MFVDWDVQMTLIFVKHKTIIFSANVGPLPFLKTSLNKNIAGTPKCIRTTFLSTMSNNLFDGEFGLAVIYFFRIRDAVAVDGLGWLLYDPGPLF